MTVTGGVRDTLAAALLGLGINYSRGEVVYLWPDDEKDLHRNGDWRSFGERSEAMQEHRVVKVADGLLDALSSPEVVRVATEALTEHHGTVETGRHAISGLPYRYVRCCGIPRPKENHAAHQWSVLVAALRGER